MCGRYSFAQLSSEVEKRFKIQVDGNTYVARYNCAPTQSLAVITNQEPEKLSFLHWGLIPFWSKDNSNAAKMINARGETLIEKPAFKEAFKSKRCLIPADGFYEWKKHTKTPFHIRLKSRELFSFAGIWDEWIDGNGNPKRTFSVITTSANKIMQNIHHRMPLILPEHLEQDWLKNQDLVKVEKLIQAYDSTKMEVFEVSTLVNSVKNECSQLIKPFLSDKQMTLDF